MNGDIDVVKIFEEESEKLFSVCVSLAEAKGLTYGETLYSMQYTNADGSPQRFRVNGKPKTWKRSPQRVQIPVKRGLYQYEYITEDDLWKFSLSESAAAESIAEINEVLKR